jgi:hypothetical protein
MDFDDVVSGDAGSFSQELEITENDNSPCFPSVFSSHSETYSAPVSVDVLIIGGFDYPIFQFFQFPMDAGCLYVHWHSPGAACSINGGASFASDPDPPGCGYGTKTAIATVVAPIPGPIDPGDPATTLAEATRTLPSADYASFPGGAPWPACP